MRISCLAKMCGGARVICAAALAGMAGVVMLGSAPGFSSSWNAKDAAAGFAQLDADPAGAILTQSMQCYCSKTADGTVIPCVRMNSTYVVNETENEEPQDSTIVYWWNETAPESGDCSCAPLTPSSPPWSGQAVQQVDPPAGDELCSSWDNKYALACCQGCAEDYIPEYGRACTNDLAEVSAPTPAPTPSPYSGYYPYR